MILNRTTTEAEFCGRVPLNQTNLIQSHGVLLVVARHTDTIIQCSENTESLLACTAGELIGKHLDNLMPPEEIQELKRQLAESSTQKLPFVLQVSTGRALALMHQTDDLIIMEIEEFSNDSSSFVAVHSLIKSAIAAITGSEDVVEACGLVAIHLKKISGFDKVMIYRFDADWNGEVIAEAKEEDMESYFGFTFPASDIPKQAREMYQRNTFRFIPDVDYVPVKLKPVINPLTGGFTDLTDTNLRSVAPVHIEYLRNMKVSASMSTRILKNGRLWGLIACHHKTPKFLPYSVCSIFELLSDIISSKVVSIETDFSYRQMSKQWDIFRTMMTGFQKRSIADSFQNNKEVILKLLGATGACLYYKKRFEKIGVTPEGTDMEDLLYWIDSQGWQSTSQVNHLAASYDPAERYASIASGLLFIPFNNYEDCIIAFRPEVVQEVSWGGNPDEAVLVDSDNRSYHPRHSFKQWKEQVRQQSLPWSEEESAIAETFAAFLNALTD